jgi:hypothetical protein
MRADPTRVAADVGCEKITLRRKNDTAALASADIGGAPRHLNAVPDLHSKVAGPDPTFRVACPTQEI